MQLSTLMSAVWLAVGLSMPPDARPCWRGSWDIFVQTTSIRSMRSGRDSVASSSGTVTNGGGVFPITPTVVERGAGGGPKPLFAGVGGCGFFLFPAAQSAHALFLS